eukprot:6203364-Pleurochrysis_carterae.AAC.4
MKGVGCTRAIGSGSPRRGWTGTGRASRRAFPPTPHAHAQGGHKAYARPPCLWCAPACVECALLP